MEDMDDRVGSIRPNSMRNDSAAEGLRVLAQNRIFSELERRPRFVLASSASEFDQHGTGIRWMDV